MERKDCTLEVWKKYIFIDKSTFEMGKFDGSIMVHCRPREAYKEDCLLPTFKSGLSTSNHWGAIEYNAHSELVCLHGKGCMNGSKYVELILKGQLKDFYKHVTNPLEKPPIVIEDNAPCHTAKVAKAEHER